MKKLLVSFLCILFFLAGCSNKVAYQNDYSAGNAYTEEAVSTEMSYNASGAVINKVDVQSDAKLIKKVWVDAETEHYEDDLKLVLDKLNRVNGYIENQYSYNGRDSYYGSRYTNYTLRIPADKLNDFIHDVEGVVNVVSYQENTEDVTLSYNDLKTHIAALTKEEERLLELMDKAETLTDLLTIEDRLTEVRYQLESIQSRFLVMENKIEYATVYLDINEVVKYTNVKQTFLERISSGWSERWSDFKMDMEDLAVGIIINIPYILFDLALVSLVVFVLVKAVKWIRLKRKKDQ